MLKGLQVKAKSNSNLAQITTSHNQCMLEMADDVYVFGTDEQVDEGIIQFLREQDPDWSDWDDYDGEVGEDEDDDEEQPQLAPPRARQQVPQLPPLPPAQPQPPLQVQATQDPEEQDPDFMSQSNVVVRARVGTAISSVPEPRPKNVETEVHRSFYI